jgi:uncharacterized repeat protein (TIGR03803 family)
MRRAVLMSVVPALFLASSLEPGSEAQGASTYTTLYSFTGKNQNGEYPSGPLLFDSEGAIYGTTTGGGGGTGINGVVFKLTPGSSGWSESVLHAFTGGNDGEAADSGVVFGPSGVLYGTTYGGGNSPYGGSYGTVFELTPSGSSWTHTVLYNFQGGLSGTGPGPVVLGSNGALYGTTFYGGKPKTPGCPGVGCGIVFELTQSGGTWTENVLHSFAHANGNNPLGPLVVGGDGTVYGVTNSGGPTGRGVVFSLTPSGTSWTYTVLYAFTGGNGNDDGFEPSYGLVAGANGVMYGVTAEGGPGPCYSGQGCGTVFEMVPPAGGQGWTIKILYDFAGGNDGANPVSLMLGEDGNLYGTTYFGGSSKCNEGCGTVFQLSPNGSTWTETVLYRWTGSTQGSTVALQNSLLYGTTFQLGTSNLGSVFTLTP